MGPERRRQAWLGAVALVLALVLYRAWPRTSVVPAVTPGPRGVQRASGTAAAPEREAPPPSSATDVHLWTLEGERLKPAGSERNLFRFKPKPPPPPVARAAGPGATAPPPAASGPPPPPPPITLKFIGVMDRGEGKPKIAILSDGSGPPMYGVEGQTIAGRYRILRIGAESVEMAHLDGRGRQTIRLSGS